MKRNLEKYEELKKLGLKEREIAERFGISILDLRAWLRMIAIEKNQAKRKMIEKLKSKGLNLAEIAEKMNVPVSTVEAFIKRKENRA